jgi:predicted acylesterase/phospholipase RssA
MPDDEQDPVTRAQRIMRGAYEKPADIFALATQLKRKKVFYLAWPILARARRDPALAKQHIPPLRFAQEQALCTYKDVNLPAEQRFRRALDILENDCNLAHSTDPETLGLAGAIYKYWWQSDGQRQHLDRSLRYYLKGHEAGSQTNPYYDGYPGINAAFVLDVLANLEHAEARAAWTTSVTAAQCEARAREIRQQLVDHLTKLQQDPKKQSLQSEWWFLVTVAEAYFGLKQYPAATEWLKRARQLPDTPDWEVESTVRQLAALARLQEDAADVAPGARPDPQTWTVLKDGLGISELSARVAVLGKVGLALSGGGFRAALFHIGVLARLAELDMLRHVEVLSCVSGGSIIGAHYYLEVRKLLREKRDEAITREDYVRIVRRITDDFVAGVQKNLRTRIAANFWTNFRMMLSSSHTPTERLGALYETHLFARINDGENDRDRWLNKLFIQPAGEVPGFQPKLHNWRRQAKAPILILNATTLNTCHNWQFTASYMGESPALIDAEIDGNNRMRRVYYGDAPPDFRQFRLGRAVAASSCVPGLFAPITLPGLYPKYTVRLVDGGVHDNQGIVGLQEQECGVLLVSDASGQTDVQTDSAKAPVGVLLRSNSILMARVRQAECEDIKRGQRTGRLHGLMLVHLKKNLAVDPVDWADCRDPHDASEASRPPEERGPLTPYGVDRVVQRELAALRTDLDSFSDLEAFALMASAYAMTRHEFPDAVKRFLAPADGSIPWSFQLALQSWIGTPVAVADPKLELLKVGSSQAFKVWQVGSAWKLGAAILAFGLLGWLVCACLRWWFASQFTAATFLLSAVAAAIGIALLFWIAVHVHLGCFDPMFLKRGQLHLRHDQTMKWIGKKRGWRRARRTGRVYVRELAPDEKKQAFPSADGIPQRGDDGEVLCVGAAGEAWFEPLVAIQGRYDMKGSEQRRFAFDSQEYPYTVCEPKAEALCWAAQLQEEGITSFSVRPRAYPPGPVLCAAGDYVVWNGAGDPYREPASQLRLVAQAIFASSYQFAE